MSTAHIDQENRLATSTKTSQVFQKQLTCFLSPSELTYTASVFPQLHPISHMLPFYSWQRLIWHLVQVFSLLLQTTGQAVILEGEGRLWDMSVHWEASSHWVPAILCIWWTGESQPKEKDPLVTTSLALIFCEGNPQMSEVQDKQAILFSYKEVEHIKGISLREHKGVIHSWLLRLYDLT